MINLNLQLFAYNSKKYDVANAIKSYGNAVKSDFTYDPTTDAAYQAYAKEYARLGEKARQDTLGAAASLTGGYASSYAVSAAAQAQNDYNRQLTAVIPELQQAAYNKWSDKLNNQLNYTNLLMDADSESWSRWANNRDFAYQKKRDNVADSQWSQEYLLAKKASESSGSKSSSGGSSGSSGGSSGSGSSSSSSSSGSSGSSSTISKYRSMKLSGNAATLNSEIGSMLMARTSSTSTHSNAISKIQSAVKSGKITQTEAYAIIYKNGLNSYL